MKTFTVFNCFMLRNKNNQRKQRVFFTPMNERTRLHFTDVDWKKTRTRYFCRQWVDLKLISV